MYGVATVSPADGRVAYPVVRVSDLVEKPTAGRGAEQSRRHRSVRPVADHFFGAAGDPARPRKRNPAHRCAENTGRRRR